MTDTESTSGGADAPGEETPSGETVLDVRGLKCPMPLLKAKQALNGLPAGGLLRVLATDPGSERDFETFSRQSGHALLESERRDDTFAYLLKKKDA